MPGLDRRTFLARLAQSALLVAGLTSGCSNPSPAAPSPTKPLPTATSQPTPTQPPSPVPTKAAAAPASPAASGPTATPTPAPTATAVTPPDIAVAHGSQAQAITRAAVDALGGIGRFVKSGQQVLIKPNICTSREPQYAATTNPEVVAALVTLCREAGAGRVVVMDGGFSGMATSYRVSGIEAAVKAVGGETVVISRLKFRDTPIPQGKDIQSWSIHEDALDSDVLINVPIAKTHDLARLTLGMKNLMGLVESRESLHRNLGQRLADLGTVIKPTLVVVDAVRILTRNGPTGGNLADVKTTNTVIASVDPVAADSYAATLFGMKGDDLDYVRAGAEMGLGVKDLSQLRIGELNL